MGRTGIFHQHNSTVVVQRPRLPQYPQERCFKLVILLAFVAFGIFFAAFDSRPYDGVVRKVVQGQIEPRTTPGTANIRTWAAD